MLNFCGKRMKLWTLLAAVALLFAGLPGLAMGMGREAFARGEFTCQYSFSYRWDKREGIAVVSAPDRSAVVIPEQLRGGDTDELWDVTFISNHVFHNNSSLKNISMPSTLRFIHNNAFDGCTALEKVILPASLLNIRDEAFANCVRLKDIYFDGDAPEAGANVFKNVHKDAVIHVPNNAYGFGSRWQGLPVWYDHTPPIRKYSQTPTEQGTIAVKTADVYASPQLKYKIGALKKGDEVTVYNRFESLYETKLKNGSTIGGLISFYEIGWKGSRAYVSADYLNITFQADYKAYTGYEVRVYRSKSKNSRYSIVKDDGFARILAREDKWFKVRMGEITGYVPSGEVTEFGYAPKPE